MSGNHKRKRRNMKREWRAKALDNLVWLLVYLTLSDKYMPNSSEARDYVCRFDGR